MRNKQNKSCCCFGEEEKNVTQPNVFSPRHMRCRLLDTGRRAGLTAELVEVGLDLPPGVEEHSALFRADGDHAVLVHGDARHLGVELGHGHALQDKEEAAFTQESFPLNSEEDLRNSMKKTEGPGRAAFWFSWERGPHRLDSIN